MILTTFAGNPAWLIDDAPDWSNGVTLDAALPSHREAGLDAHEARRPLGDTLRLKLSYHALIAAPNLAPFRNALQVLATTPILCPLWCAPFAAGATPAVTTTHYALLGDGLTPEIKTNAERPFPRPAYPLLIGRLSDTPDPSAGTDELLLAELNFEENANAYAIAPPAYTPPDGLEAAGALRPLWPWRPDWESQPHTASAEMEIERRAIGQGRATADAYFAQPGRRRFSAGFTLAESEPWQLLRLVLDLGQANVWVPAALSEARLTASVAAADTALNVDEPAARGANVALVLDDLITRTPVLITGTVDDTWTLSAAVGAAYLLERTRLESLVLARLARPNLTLHFDGPGLARADLEFAEVPWEFDTDAGDPVGTTQGELETTAYLYQFSIAYPGATTYYRYTSFERALTYTNAYAAQPIEHDTIKETDQLERNSVNLTSRYFAGNPLALLIPMRLEWPLVLDIFECHAGAADVAEDVVCVFHGEIESAEFDGPYIKAVAASLGTIFDRKIPRRLLQPSCNWTLFETSCGLALADWKWEGLVTSYNATTLALVLHALAPVSPNPGHTEDAHYFAGGYLTHGTGAAAQWRMIGDSTAESAGNITLTLAAPFTTAPSVNDTIYLYPGCDGQLATCTGKFANTVKFGGFPFMPIGNPSAIKVSRNVSTGGKK